MTPVAADDVETRRAIAAVIALYCRAIDRRRWTMLEACFHDDATYTLGAIDGPWRHFADTARALIDPLPMTHHQTGQTLYEADGAAVLTETYFTAIHSVPADAPRSVRRAARYDCHVAIGGRYLDRFTRLDQDWRIARRVVTLDWRHAIPSNPAQSTVGAT